MNTEGFPTPPPAKRRPGRPPTYIFSKPDAELSENERRLKGSVIKRRLRQNRSYHRKKHLKELEATTLSLSTSKSQPLTVTTSPLPVDANSTFSTFQTSIPSLPTSASPTLPSIPMLLDKLTAVSHPLPSVPAHIPVHTDAMVPRLQLPTDPFLRNSPNLNLFTSSPIPRFDISPIPRSSHLATTIPQTTQNLSIISPTLSNIVMKRSRSAETSVEKDEERLLEQIFNVSAPNSTSQQNKPISQITSHHSLTQDFHARLSSLPKFLADGLNHLLLFPVSFSAESAYDVMGLQNHNQHALDIPTDFLQPLIETNLVQPLPSGRYGVNAIVKSLSASPSSQNNVEARRKFVSHFLNKLSPFDAKSMSMKGEHRLQGMKMYDAEKQNMKAAFDMCDEIGGKALRLILLTQAATVMRYCLSPHERIKLFRKTIENLEFEEGASRSDNVESECRIRLALAEAYFDILSLEEAEEPLQRAIGMMAGVSGGGVLSIASSVLTLLLLAEICISKRDFEEAKKLLVQALCSLKEADMRKSTFAVCCLLNLASVYNHLDCMDEAFRSVNTSLEILISSGFGDMPIYADALKTLASVHLNEGDIENAKGFAFSALNIIEKWKVKTEWDNAPFQHCGHVDIFTMELMSKTYLAQNQQGEADRLMTRAQHRRIERQLNAESVDLTSEARTDGRRNAPLYTRHIY